MAALRIGDQQGQLMTNRKTPIHTTAALRGASAGRNHEQVMIAPSRAASPTTEATVTAAPERRRAAKTTSPMWTARRAVEAAVITATAAAVVPAAAEAAPAPTTTTATRAIARAWVIARHVAANCPSVQQLRVHLRNCQRDTRATESQEILHSSYGR